ncbi:DNA repair protein RecN [Flagellimonas sp. S174]|uniref:DNA repair protein RecN n=1 Tax=Flagellimonas sp. S174 TaxID=3410790 RepID=UPI003BF4C7C4
MLTHLSIKNYALINDINVSFSEGFTTITGETGAGKSILLGGLALALGKRADLSSLQNDQLKCIIEAEFTVSNYGLREFFVEHDLDYEDDTILRREILPSGKSRAFINDSPVTLDILKSLGEQLVDVHSQHQTLRLTENDFQLKVVDALANNKERLKAYGQKLTSYKKLTAELKELEDFQAGANKEHDYNSFLLKELDTAQLKEGIQEELESEHEKLSNVEQIMELLTQGHQLMNGEQIGIAEQVQELKRIFQNLSQYGPMYDSLSKRIESIYIELDDVASEIENIQGGVEANPLKLDSINGQLQLLYDLQKKHQVGSVEELIQVKGELEEKVDAVENVEARIDEKEQECLASEKDLEKTALQIRDARNSVIPQLKSRLQDSLYTLGMPSATFKIEINPAKDFKSNGKDDLTFLFSANKGSSYGELKKVASGGELSRIMLTIKSILAQYEQLPTLMFDEIDTGVSGEISGKMGEIMLGMSKSMQVFSITHLPQVASKGKHQFKVYKGEQDGLDTTQMRQLSEEERIEELAEMLGGKALSDSAMAHARELLKQP